MRVHFRNHYTSHLCLAIQFYSPDACGGDGGSWEARGWWCLDPGAEAYVLDTDDRYAAFYAEANDGTKWSGTYGPAYVHQEAFDHCVNIGDNNPETRIVDMQLVDTQNSDDHYVNLVK